MRRRLLIAAFLGTTCLTPEPAEAGPVVPFVAGAFGVAGGTAIAATAAYAAGAAFAATAIGGFVVQAVVAVGLSKLSQALGIGPSAGGVSAAPPAARMVNFAQPVSYAETVYGRTRKGGPIGFTGFKNNRRYYVPILAAHEIEGIVEHWLDEWQVTLNGSTDQNVSNVASSSAASHARINPFLGASGQAADPGLVSAFTEITSAHDFKGLAGAAIWAKRPAQQDFSKVYPRGREWSYAPVLDGKNDIYDPRSGTSGFTNNAALVLANWFVSGLGREVDWDEVSDEADVCDQLVTNAESITQKRWTINGTLSDEQEFEDQRAQMAAACDAFVYERTDGKVGFTVGRWIEPTLTLTADDFFAFELTDGQWGADAPTEIGAVYTEPANAWRETPAGVWVEDAGARRVRDEPQLYMANSHNQATRIAKRLAKTKRPKWQLRGTIGLAGYEILGGRGGGRAHRFIRVVHTEMGVDEFFEIGELAREDVSTFTLTANSVNAADFDFDAASEEPARPSYEDVTEDAAVPMPSGLNGGALANGTILWTWADQDAAFTQEVRYREVGASNWLSSQTTESTDRLQVAGFEDGATIEAQFRNRTYGSGVSDWAPGTPVEVDVVLNPTAPGGLTGFSVSAAGSDAQVDFTAPNDANYFGTQIYRGTDNEFANATLIHTEYGIPSDGDSYTDASPGSGTFYYWAEPINSSEKPGLLSGPETVSL